MLPACLLAAGVMIAVPAAVAGARTKTVWLCKPGLAKNPCLTDLGYTTVGHGGTATAA